MSNQHPVQPEGENLDKIRDILFGRLIEEFRQRIGSLEEQHREDILRIEQDHHDKHEKLMEEIKILHSQLHEITNRLALELGERISSLEEEVAQARNEIRTVNVSRQELSALLTDMASFLSAGKD